ncbi:MAG: arginine--tRNA ligase [Chloroflexi bacterium]|nr:MAG: arginine--tRNA ligase [Chloroflexota bacterium]
MVRESIRAALVDAVRGMGVDGDMPDLELGRTKSPELGDYATSAPQKLARVLREAPDTIAARLVETITITDGAVTAEAVRGYVNFRLRDDWLRDLVSRIEPGYGAQDIGHGERLQVEFGSINPTGPLHIGHGRGVTIGDSISRLLEFTGHAVEREYYVNSDNTQTRRFGASVYARLHGQEPPEGGYLGEYVAEMAEMARRDLPEIEKEPEAEAEPKLRRYAMEKVIEQIRASVARLGVRYDNWFWEDTIWQSGLGWKAIERLREAGYIKERDGALWFGEPDEDEEDRVVIRANGQPTYFASDLGYLLSRFEERGFHRVIEVWAADHHGYVARMKAAAEALGVEPERLVIIIHQLVNLKEGRMSKRAGRFVTLDELIDRVGSDAVRYFYLLRSPDTTIETVATQQHSRLPDKADVSMLVQPWELDVARQLAFWPDVVEDATRLREPHRIPYYVHDLATAVHRFYHAGNAQSEYRVVVDDANLTRARLELCRAARHTLKTALDLMGVSAPERM